MDGSVVAWTLGGGYLIGIIAWLIALSRAAKKDYEILLRAKVPWVVEAEEWKKKQDN